jgi:hypothetical protein
MASTGPLRKIVLLGECGRLRPSACLPMLQRCSSSPRRMPLRSVPSTSSAASSRLPSSCAGGSRATPATRRLENARASSQAGRRCHCGRSRCRNRRGHGESAAESRLDDEPGRKPSTAITISAARRPWLHSHPHRTPPFGRHGKPACRKVGRWRRYKRPRRKRKTVTIDPIPRRVHPVRGKLIRSCWPIS